MLTARSCKGSVKAQLEREIPATVESLQDHWARATGSGLGNSAPFNCNGPRGKEL